MSTGDQNVRFIFKRTLEIQNEHMGLKSLCNLKLPFVFLLYLHLLAFAEVCRFQKFKDNHFFEGKFFLIGHKIKGLINQFSIFAFFKISIF